MSDEQNQGQEKIGFETLEERRAPRIGFSASALSSAVETGGDTGAHAGEQGELDQKAGMEALKGLIGGLTGEEGAPSLDLSQLNSLDSFNAPGAGMEQMISSEGGSGLYDPSQFDPPGPGIDAPGANH